MSMPLFSLASFLQQDSLPKYIDYSIIQRLLSRNGKYDITTLIGQELDRTFSEVSLQESAYYIGEIHKKGTLLQAIRSRALIPIFQMEAALVPIFAQMENTGIMLDTSKLLHIQKRIRTDIGRLEDAIFLLVGEKFNLNSPKQIQEIFFGKLGITPLKKNKTGYSVDNEVLEEIAKTHDIARLLLEYRQLTKLHSTYVVGLLKAVDVDGRVHTTYDSLGTNTGRISSNNPNLQNIPVGVGYATEIKSCFIATPLANAQPEEKQVLLVADYSQMELRILAFLSQDPGLLLAFEQKEDIHTHTARFLFRSGTPRQDGHNFQNVAEWKPNSEQRRIAKTVNFGIIFGITGFGLAKTLGVSPWEAQKYIDSFYMTYPGVRTYYTRLLEKAREQGYVETFFGRRRPIPGINDANKTLRAVGEREAMNMPIQGTEADIIKLAMIAIDARIREQHLTGKMLLQVHDELVFDIPFSEKDAFEKIIIEEMEGVFKIACPLFGEAHNQKYVQKEAPLTLVPIVVDIGIGATWADAKS